MNKTNVKMISTKPETKPSIVLSEITVSDGTTIELGESDILILVGPNNVGKSVLLREIDERLKTHKSNRKVLADLAFKKSGTLEDVLAWLEKVSKKFTPNQTSTTFAGLQASIQLSTLTTCWSSDVRSLGDLVPFFVWHLNTDSRLGLASPPGNVDVESNYYSHPIHYLQFDGALEKRIGNHFKKLFGQDLLVNRHAGDKVPLHIGERATVENVGEPYSRERAEAMLQLPRLERQGDGMRAFAGVLLYSLVPHHSLLLVDEPEAFLHPPQARLLGQLLAKELPDGKQMVVSSHSGDFLRGLLDRPTTRVRVVRLQRAGNINPVRELKNEDIQTLWNDAILRYSNILDGLFHERVIVCEADTDCRFYAAMLDAVVAEDEAIRAPDLLFTSVGGKDRLHTACSALSAVGVPVTAICDIDVLSDEQPLRRIVEALGAKWSEVEGDALALRKHIGGLKTEKTLEEVKVEIDQAISATKGATMTRELSNKIRTLTKAATPWALLKRSGASYIGSGEPTVIYKRLTDKLRAIGLHIVPVGELEGFDKRINLHGAAWVNKVLSGSYTSDPELKPAKDFIRLVCL